MSQVVGKDVRVVLERLVFCFLYAYFHFCDKKGLSFVCFLLLLRKLLLFSDNEGTICFPCKYMRSKK